MTEQAGHWFVSLAVEQEVAEPDPSGDTLGVDAGIKTLATVSDDAGGGRTFDNPKSLRRAEVRLRRLQKAVSRKQRGSTNRRGCRAASSSALPSHLHPPWCDPQGHVRDHQVGVGHRDRDVERQGHDAKREAVGVSSADRVQGPVVWCRRGQGRSVLSVEQDLLGLWGGQEDVRPTPPCAGDAASLKQEPNSKAA